MTLQPGSRPVPNSPDYQLIRKLGAGAFGEVWHGHGPGGLDVALKFIRLDAHGLAVELRSLEAVKSIRHPNLVSLFGAWQKDNWVILAMELCDRSLQERLKEALSQQLSGLPLPELLNCMSDAANGLDALNAKGVQHRDVKPANLLLLDSGVKVADFGLAKVLEHTVASNSSGGTIAYMAPECFRGQLTSQSDQYSLAVTYYHLRTGQLLFKGDQAQVMYAHLELEPDLSQLPSSERSVLARALSKEPGKRWVSCKAFVNEVINAEAERQRKEAERRRQEQERQKREAEVAERKRQEQENRKKAEENSKKKDARGLADPARGRLLKMSASIPFTDKNALGFYFRGMDCFQNENYDKANEDFDMAIQLFGEAIRSNPNNTIAYLYRGMAWSGKSDAWLGTEAGNSDKAIMDFDEAIRLFDVVIRSKPNNAFAYLHRGRAWLGKSKWNQWDTEDHDKGIMDFDKAIQLDPNYAEAFCHRGMASSFDSSFDKAIKDFDKAILLDPEYSTCYSNRGTTWLSQKHYDKAIKDYNAAVKLDPQNALFFNRRGFAWYFKKYLEKAVEDFDKAIQLDPHNRYAYRCRSFIWLGKKDFDKAIKNCDEIISLRPRDAFFYYQRGEAWLGKKDFDAAIKNYDEAVRLSPWGYAAFALSGRGTAWLGKKDYDKAIKDFNESIQIDRYLVYYGPCSWSFTRSTLLEGNIDYHNANNDFQEAIWLDPKSKFALVKLAWLFATCPEEKFRDGKRAIRMATLACERTDWKSGFELDILASGYAEECQFDEAVRWQTKALEDPNYRGPAGEEFRQRLELYKQKNPFRLST